MVANFTYLLLLNELFIWVIFGHTSGDLFCTRALSWWPILYIGKHFFTLLIFMGYFVYLLLLGEPIFTWEIFYDNVHVLLVTYSVHTHTYYEDLYSSDFYGLFHFFLLVVLIFTNFMVILWWPILYTYFYLGDLFCTYGCFWRLILYSYFPSF